MIGLIRNLQDEQSFHDKPQHSIYAEIQLGGTLLSFVNGGGSFGGALYGGYWDDFIGERSNACIDCITYSYSSFIVGVRASFTPANALVPITLLTGLASHFIAADRVGGSDIAGDPGKDFRKGLNTAEIGLQLNLPLNNRLQLQGKVRQFFPLGDSWLTKSRRAFLLGIAYTFGRPGE